MVELSGTIVRLIEQLIPIGDQVRIRQRLLDETSGDLGFSVGTPEGMERIRFSILRLIAENPSNEDHAFGLARTDPRDLFMASGHGYEVNAHTEWARQVLKDSE